MTMNESKDYCVECRKMTTYRLEKRNMVKTVRGKDYSFLVTCAVCSECGSKMAVPGLIDANIQEIDKQYRDQEGLVSVDDILKLMKIYKIGKAPLSLALGFGEVTITRYLEGQIPSKEYSEIVRAALSSPSFMKARLMVNRDKLSDAAYQKSYSAAENLIRLFTLSDSMLRVISYLFDKLEEVTPLMLQKLLYFTQGLYCALYGLPIFEEECEAWIHGPVFPEVYELFRDFRYDPIEDERFAFFERAKDELTPEERRVADLVADTFGVFSGKTLERITHNEIPWQEARKNYGEGIPSDEVVTKKSIMQYYVSVDEKYGIGTEKGLMKYIDKMLEVS